MTTPTEKVAITNIKKEPGWLYSVTPNGNVWVDRWKDGTQYRVYIGVGIQRDDGFQYEVDDDGDIVRRALTPAARRAAPVTPVHITPSAPSATPPASESAPPASTVRATPKEPRSTRTGTQAKTSEDVGRRSPDGLRKYIKTTLPDLLRRDPRWASSAYEMTLQAIIWHHLSHWVEREWHLEIEAFVGKTGLKADIVIEKLTLSGETHPQYGLVAIEVKPNAEIQKLIDDIEKLKTYIKRTEVNFGVLIYRSNQSQYDDAVKEHIAKSGHERRIFAVRVPKS